ncbi:polysaccharide deacetylase family protein [Haloferula sargassicola]|uniref:NodB homology domain-containing protein n=1 Tax=Haloferula sargassicola TaxID=490096 RepID=A0ABP9UNZ6_9BACT
MRRTIHPDRRAAAPLFRSVWDAPICGERTRLAGQAGMNRAEFRVLSLIMPGVAALAVFDALWTAGGAGWAWLGVLPITWLLLHGLVFALGVAGPRSAFWIWSAVFSAWAVWRVTGGGWAMGVAAAWLVFVALQLVARPVAGLWAALMAVRGWAGVGVRLLACGVVHVPSLAWCWHSGYGWELLAVLATGLLWVWGTFVPGSQVFGPTARRVEGDGVLITVDDGPDPEDTPRLLDLLDAHGCRAVFFVIGDQVRRYPELAREIVARGHELGNHTMTHPQATVWCAGPWRTRREIRDCQQAIEEATGVRPRWYRAPVGHRNYFTHPFATELGLEVVAWSRRGFDTVERDVGKIVSALCDGAGNGDILLLHESTPVAAEVMKAVLERCCGTGSGREENGKAPPPGR